MNGWSLVVAVVLVALNGVFVAKEFSLIASRRTRLEALAEDGNARARFAVEATKDLPLQLASSQLGVTMCSLGLGAVAEPAIAHTLEKLFAAGPIPEGLAQPMGLVIGLAIVAFVHMVFGEMMPKYASLADPERMLMRLSLPNAAYVAVFRPVIRVINAIGNAGTRLFGVQPRTELESTHTAEELSSMLAASREEGLIEETAHELLSGALGFRQRTLAEVMVARDDVVWISRRATVAEAEALVVSSGHSRLLVVGRDLDDPVGFVHAKDLLTVPDAARDRPLPLSRIRRVLSLPGDRRLDSVLVTIRRSRTHLTVVVDDDRRVIGLATLEDVLEQYVGDIQDESDRPVAPRPRRRVRP